MNIKETKQGYIIASAIWFKDDKQYPHQPENIKSGFVLTGHRHHNIFSIGIIFNTRINIIKHTQGFLTSKGYFVDRYQAYGIATYNGQVDKEKAIKKDSLFSEDLW